jgi:alcohol dehydrogenase class IV
LNPRLHHGTLNAIFLPAVLAFNEDAETVRQESKMPRIAQAMGLESASAIGPAIRDMTRRLGMPAGLAELGVTADMFPAIVKGALADHSHQTNPRIATSDDYLRMLDQSM